MNMDEVSLLLNILWKSSALVLLMLIMLKVYCKTYVDLLLHLVMRIKTNYLDI